MRSTWNRRELVRLATSGGLIAAAVSSASNVAVAQTPGGAKLGDGQDVFEAEFGAGTDVGGGMIQFGSADSETAVYYVRFTESGADHIEVDFTHLQDGGIPEEDVDIGNSRFMPDDANMTRHLREKRHLFVQEGYHFTTWHSEALASATGRTGNVLVLDSFAVQMDGPGNPAPYDRATISMESFDVHEVHPHGDMPKLGSSFSDWTGEYGQAPASQRWSHVANPPVERLFFDTDEGGFVDLIDSKIEPGIPIQEAIDLIGLFLPENATLAETYFAPPSPTGPIGVRTQIWNASALKAVPLAVMIYVNGPEESGTVSRILMVMLPGQDGPLVEPSPAG